MNVRRCALRHCGRVYSSTISHHIFPRDKCLRYLWEKKTKLKSTSNAIVICSWHFRSSDFFPQVENRKYKKLFPFAVPSIDLVDVKLKLKSLDSLRRDRQLESRNRRIMDRSRGFALSESISNVEIAVCCVEHINDNEALSVQQKAGPSKNTVKEQDLCREEKMKTVSKELKEVSVNTVPLEEIIDKVERINDTHKRGTLLDFVRNEQLNAFCGVRRAMLQAITNAVSDYEGISDLQCCDTLNRVALVFCKLKLNLSFICLSVLFDLEVRTASRYFYKTLRSLATVLRDAISWPTKEQILSAMPKCFQDYKNTRVIVDCTEVAIEKPSCLQCRLKTYSAYKGRETVNVLIGITPSGEISFLSKAYGGNASDKAIFVDSKILDKLEPKIDAVMADKGFLIEAECAKRRVELIRPPFLRKKEQFNSSDRSKTKSIAAARVHVERAIQRMKIFKIMCGIVPCSMLKHFDEIVLVIGAIVNLSPPIIGENGF